jgi:hypothetical protein
VTSGQQPRGAKRDRINFFYAYTAAAASGRAGNYIAGEVARGVTVAGNPSPDV